MLRAVQVGLSLADLDNLEYGEVTDMIIERENDDHNYQRIATQEDYDRF